MKKRLLQLASTLALLVSTLSPLSVKAAGNVEYYLTPPSPSVANGATTRLDLRMSAGATQVDTVQLDLSYDASKLQYLSTDVSKSAFADGPPPIGANGKINIVLFNYFSPVTADELLATISFKALVGSGTAVVSFDNTTLAVSVGQDVTGAVHGATVALTGGGTTPNPTPNPTPTPNPNPNPNPNPTPTPQPGPVPGPQPNPNPGPGPSPNPSTPSTPSSRPQPSPSPVNKKPSTSTSGRGGTTTPSPTPSPTPSTPVPITDPNLANGLSISGINISDISADSITIEWQTNRPTTSVLSYGTSSSYGFTAKDPVLATEHSVTIDGEKLIPGMVYYYNITVTDKDGYSATSTQQSFRSQGYTVNLTANDKKGKPLKGAGIKLGDQSTKTGDTGTARFYNVPFGKVQATVTFNGQTDTQTITVTNSTAPQNVAVKFNISQGGGSGAIVWLFIILFLLVIVIGVILYIIKRRNGGGGSGYDDYSAYASPYGDPSAYNAPTDQTYPPQYPPPGAQVYPGQDNGQGPTNQPPMGV